MKKTANLSALALALCACSTAVVAADHFVLMQSGERIGTMDTTVSGNRVNVDWRVDNNGRGSKYRETIELGKDGLPDRWRIVGNAWFGSPVNERFERDRKMSRWQSLNDEGSSPDTGAVYLPNESSAWSYGLYLRRLLQSPNGRVRTAPDGELRLERIREHKLQSATGAVPITLYALWGLDFTPTYLVAGKDGEYLGFVAPGLVFIAAALENQYATLSELADTLDRDYLAQLTQRLSNKFADPYWIRNVRVFDSATGQLGAPTNVVVHGDRIVGIRSDAPPADAIVIEGEGGALLPGLHDMHTHNSAWSGPLHLAAGVTQVRDMGNDNDALRSMVQRSDSGASLAPHISMRGFLEGRSPFSSRGGFVVEQLNVALDKVRWYADHGYSGIKIYNSMTPDWVQPIVAEAHRLGLSVSGHIPAFMSPERAVRDGYDEINHINQLMLGFVLAPQEDTRTPLRLTAFGERVGRVDLQGPAVARMVALMRERGVALDPTLQLTGNIMMSRPGTVAPGDRDWLAHMSAPFQRSRKVMFLDIKPAQYPLYAASWKTAQEMVLRLHRAGVRIIPGTDDMPGFSLISELESYVAAGFTPAEALQAATVVSAKHLGTDAVEGSIAIGKRADLILVDGDPTRDIGSLRKLRMTVKAGTVFFPEEIDAAMGIKPFATRPVLKRPAPASR